MKILEEKAKKRPRLNNEEQEKQLASKFEQIEYEKELGTIVKRLVKLLPEQIQEEMERKHLNLAFGLAPAPNLKPPSMGSIWSTIQRWPDIKKPTNS